MSERVGRRRQKHPRPQTSCSRCHRRKVRCNSQQPCNQCIRQRCESECRFDGCGPRTSSPPPSVISSSAIIDEETNAEAQPLDAPDGDGLGDEEISDALPESLLPSEPPPSAALDLEADAGCLPSAQTCPPSRGRSHSSSLFHLIDPLVAHLSAADGQHPQSPCSALLDRQRSAWRRQLIHRDNPSMMAALEDQLPAPHTARALVARYFETFNSVYTIVDEAAFEAEFAALIYRTKLVRPGAIVQTLLMLALASATYPPESSPIPREQALSWLSMASTMPTSALELEEINVDTLRCILLLSLAKQSMSFNETADYVYSGAGARYAMLLGLHRPVKATAGLDAQQAQMLWFTACDLELHACLAAGMMPTGFRDVQTIDGGSEANDAHSSEGLQRILLRSFPIRTQIVTMLNADQEPSFETAVRLGRQLTLAMAPISTSGDPRVLQPGGLHASFQQLFVDFSYRKFLVALHQPFAVLRRPVYFLSTNICNQHSQVLLRQMCCGFRSVSAEVSEDTSFFILLAGNGTLFRAEILKSLLYITQELYNEDESYLDTHAILSSGSANSRHALLEVVDQVLNVAQGTVSTNQHAGIMFSIPSLVHAHLDAAQQSPRGSDGYSARVTTTARELARSLPMYLL